MDMRRLSTIAALVLAPLIPAGAVAAGDTYAPATAHEQELPRAVLQDAICQKALDPPARAVSVTAVMRPLTGTKQLALKFELLERPAGTLTWRPMSGPGLGVWISPTNPPTLGQRPGDVWLVKMPVADLSAPASYRFSVAFRWTGRHAKVLGTSLRLSNLCDQPELRPDLTVNSISVATDLSYPKLDDYTAVIGDVGETGAGPFAVQLSDGGVVRDKTIQHLDAHSTRTVVLVGPDCEPAQPPTVTVDPADQIDVYSRSQATMTASCM